MSAHTKRSPSQAKRFLACNGALALCESLPEEQRNQAGIAARLGTATHGLIEECLRKGKEPESYRGRIILLVGDDEEVSILRPGAKVPGPGTTFFEVDSDMIDGATIMTDYVRKRCKELGIAESALQLETRTNPLPERDDTSGTADVTIDAWPVELEVVDYKNGWNVVEHKGAEQLLAYLLGKALEADFAHERYKITIVQPNAPHAEGKIRDFAATKEELLAFQERYRAGIEKNEVAEQEFSQVEGNGKQFDKWAKAWLAAGDHCMFCDAIPVCPAYKKRAQAEAKMDFKEEPRELEFSERPEEVSRILKWAPQLEALIKAANLWAQRSMESGHEMPDFKLVRGRSVRKLRDDMAEPALVAAILKGKFVAEKSALYTEPKLLSGPQIEGLVARKRREEFNEKFLVKPEGALTVASADDPREEVICKPGDDFKDADEEDFG